MKNETISAFAFRTGKMIEELIDKETDRLNNRNMFLEAKILSFRNELVKTQTTYFSADLLPDYLEKFDKHFEIQIDSFGKI